LIGWTLNEYLSMMTGDSARFTSELMGKMLQERSTVNTNDRGTSTSQSLQLDPALPASKIATLSSGEFVGITADSPDQPMPLKAFHCQFQIEQETQPEDIFMPVRKITIEAVEQTFQRIQEDVRLLVEARLEEMRQTPDLARLILNPKVGARRRKQTRL
jgi:hypothetical protein